METEVRSPKINWLMTGDFGLYYKVYLMKKSIIVLIAILLSGYYSGYAQLSEAQEKAIDSLFLEWNTPNHPGGVFAINQGGKRVYSKAFGLASLEYLVPNTTGTRFNIASISKQFTAMAIVKLHLEGKLSIDADIREYLPELPDFGEKVTCRHMLHHTSGLRSLHAMLGLAGWRGDDTRTNEDLFRYVLNQKDLNFKPGDEYMYCNTGYILMAIIVERLTGENFADWMTAEIFEPLGLNDTYVEDRYNRIVANNATSYYRRGDEFIRSVEYWGYTGSGNIHSSADDLLKWYRYYYKAPEGWQEAFKMMQTTDPFNDGKPNNYAFGVNVREFLGEKSISHGGSIGGFRSYAVTFPEKETEVVVITNFSSSGSGTKANQAISILFDKPLPERQPRPEQEDKKPYMLTDAEMKAIAGDYWSTELETIYRFYMADGKLFISHNRFGEFEIEAIDRNNLRPIDSGIRKIEVIRDRKGKVTGMLFTNSRVRNLKFVKLSITLP